MFKTAAWVEWTKRRDGSNYLIKIAFSFAIYTVGPHIKHDEGILSFKMPLITKLESKNLYSYG